MTTSSLPAAPYKILIAFSLDETGDWSLLEGLRLSAGRSDCEVHLVHAIANAGHSAADDSMRAAEARFDSASGLIRTRVERIWSEAGERQVIGHIGPGSAVDTILQTATDIDADLLIVGTHRRAGVEKLVLGSVAERVLRGARCPVLVALPKDYVGASASPRIVPPCPECLAVRQHTSNETYWCKRHSEEHVKPHVYEPRHEGRTSVMPTY